MAIGPSGHRLDDGSNAASIAEISCSLELSSACACVLKATEVDLIERVLLIATDGSTLVGGGFGAGGGGEGLGGGGGDGRGDGGDEAIATDTGGVGGGGEGSGVSGGSGDSGEGVDGAGGGGEGEGGEGEGVGGGGDGEVIGSAQTTLRNDQLPACWMHWPGWPLTHARLPQLSLLSPTIIL